MATQSVVRAPYSPSPCVLFGGSSGGGEGGSRVATAVWLPRRANSCTLRCSQGESDVTAPSAVELAPPTIDLEILGPEEGGEVTKTSVGSGEKLLRNIILDNKLELYGLYVAIWR